MFSYVFLHLMKLWPWTTRDQKDETWGCAGWCSVSGWYPTANSCSCWWDSTWSSFLLVLWACLRHPLKYLKPPSAGWWSFRGGGEDREVEPHACWSLASMSANTHSRGWNKQLKRWDLFWKFFRWLEVFRWFIIDATRECWEFLFKVLWLRIKESFTGCQCQSRCLISPV